MRSGPHRCRERQRTSASPAHRRAPGARESKNARPACGAGAADARSRRFSNRCATAATNASIEASGATMSGANPASLAAAPDCGPIAGDQRAHRLAAQPVEVGTNSRDRAAGRKEQHLAECVFIRSVPDSPSRSSNTSTPRPRSSAAIRLGRSCVRGSSTRGRPRRSRAAASEAASCSPSLRDAASESTPPSTRSRSMVAAGGRESGVDRHQRADKLRVDAERCAAARRASARNTARSASTHHCVGSWLTAAYNSRGKVVVARERLHRERSLCHGRHHSARIERHGVGCLHTEPGQPRHSEHDCIVLTLAQFAQTRIDVAAQTFIAQIGAQRMQLRAAPLARGADGCAGGKRVEARVAFAAERIAWIIAFRDRGELHVGLELPGKILARVHRVVGAAVEQRDLEFFDPHVHAAQFARPDDLARDRRWSSRLRIVVAIPRCASAGGDQRVCVIASALARDAHDHGPSGTPSYVPPRNRRDDRFFDRDVRLRPDSCARVRQPGDRQDRAAPGRALTSSSTVRT